MNQSLRTKDTKSIKKDMILQHWGSQMPSAFLNPYLSDETKYNGLKQSHE